MLDPICHALIKFARLAHLMGTVVFGCLCGIDAVAFVHSTLYIHTVH